MRLFFSRKLRIERNNKSLIRLSQQRIEFHLTTSRIPSTVAIFYLIVPILARFFRMTSISYFSITFPRKLSRRFFFVTSDNIFDLDICCGRYLSSKRKQIFLMSISMPVITCLDCCNYAFRVVLYQLFRRKVFILGFRQKFSS